MVMATLFLRIIFKFRNGGIARIFQGEGGEGGGSHYVNPGYLPDWHVDTSRPCFTKRDIFLSNEQ